MTVEPMKLNSAGEPFEIYLVWSDATLTVAANETALDVLVAAGVPVQPSCRSGYCGECAMPYVEGDLLHNDSCLSDTDRNHVFCPCVSRAQTRIAVEA